MPGYPSIVKRTRARRRSGGGPGTNRPTIAILHGYLLERSGSNLWTQSVVRALCRAGRTIHLMCQEPHPEKFDFIAEAILYDYDEMMEQGASSPEIM